MSRITHRRRWALGVALAVVVQLALIGPPTSAGAAETDDTGPDLEGTPNLWVRRDLGRQWNVTAK